MNVTITPEGIDNYAAFLRSFPVATKQAMALSLNDTARDALPIIKEQIYKEVNFPPGYLDLDGRLGIPNGGYATIEQPQVTITARDRGTSLARFAAPGTSLATKGGINVQVSPNKSTFFPTGFLVGLNEGNIGFAIRLKPGESIVKGVQRFQPIEIYLKYAKPGKGRVFLLYGPSVAQVFQDVRITLEPRITDMLEAEFMRQFTRLAGSP